MGVYDRAVIAKTLVHTTFEVDKGPFVLASIPLKEYNRVMEILAALPGESYVEMIRDSEEISIVITQDMWKKYFEKEFGMSDIVAPLIKIFCRVMPEYPTCTGYLLAILDRLSTNNIGVYVQGAFVTDHIFVDAENTDKVVQLLTALKTDMQNKENEV